MIDLVADDMKESANALPFSSVGAAKPALRFYADASVATRSLQRLVGRRSWMSPVRHLTVDCRYCSWYFCPQERPVGSRHMDNIIPFPIRRTDKLHGILTTIRGNYVKAGLSAAACDAAIEELGPILEKYLKKFESVLEIPACGLTNDQADMITSACNKFVQEIRSYFEEQICMALGEIAGLIGSKHDT
jgi:hypothetical protein